MRLDNPSAFLPFMRDEITIRVTHDAEEVAVRVKACVSDPDTSAGVALAPTGWNTGVAFRAEDWPEREIPSVGSTIDPDTANRRWPRLTVAKAWRQAGLVFLSCSAEEAAL